MKKKILLIVIIAVFMLASLNAIIVYAATNQLNVSLKSTETTPGGKVYVDLKNVDASADKMNFYMGGANQYLTIEVKDIHTANPYFIMPANVIAGSTYGVGMVETIDVNGNHKTYETNDIQFGNSRINVLDISIKNLSIKGSTTVNENSKLYLDFNVSDNVNFVTMALKNKNSALGVVLLSVQDLKTNPYLDLLNIGTQKLYTGEYYISDVFLNPDNGQRYVHYSTSAINEDELPLYPIDFTIKSNSTNNTQQNKQNDIILDSISLSKTEAKLNDKVYVNISADKTLTEVMLSFKDQTSNNMMTVYLKDLDTDNPYFIVPYTTECATYELNYAILKDEEANEIHYRKDVANGQIKHFDFNSKIEIKKSIDLESGLIVLDNENITPEIINEIAEVQEDISIEINANNNPVISEALFNAIKKSNKIIIIKYYNVEWIFNGRDIKETKSIDASVNMYKVNDDENSNIKDMINEGVILEFAENGQLPGKCLIRIFSEGDIEEELNNQEAKVYYYNDDSSNFNKVKMHTIITKDNYYEFYINHNSKYVMTKNAIDEKYLSSETSDLDLNENTVNDDKKIENKEINKELIIQIAVIITCIIILILIGKGKILSNKNKKKDEITNK